MGGKSAIFIFLSDRKAVLIEVQKARSNYSWLTNKNKPMYNHLILA